MTDPPVSIDRPKRLVTLRRDGDDFVVLFYPEDIVVLRYTDPQALRKMCFIPKTLSCFATLIRRRFGRCARFSNGRSLAIVQLRMTRAGEAERGCNYGQQAGLIIAMGSAI